jgi:hypothetical protein
MRRNNHDAKEKTDHSDHRDMDIDNNSNFNRSNMETATLTEQQALVKEIHDTFDHEANILGHSEAETQLIQLKKKKQDVLNRHVAKRVRIDRACQINCVSVKYSTKTHRSGIPAARGGSTRPDKRQSYKPKMSISTLIHQKSIDCY